MSKPKHDEVSTQLQKLGGIQVDNFSMGDRERKRPAAPDGYCEGIVLDWIRRVLQGGRASISPKSGNPDSFIKVQTQAARQAQAYLEWVPTKEKWEDQYSIAKKKYETTWNQTNNAKLARLETLEKKLIEVLTPNLANPQVTLTAEVINLINECFGIRVPVMLDTNKLVRLYQEVLPKEASAFNTARKMGADPDNRITKTLHDRTRQRAWQEFSGKLDKFGDKKKKRSFSNILLLYSGPELSNLTKSGVEENLAHIGTIALKERRAIKINLGGMQGNKLFCHSTGSYLNQASHKPYRFLDPNYGIIAYSSWSEVTKAIFYLYTQVYNWTDSPGVKNIPFNTYGLQIDVFGS
jgi:hypothetical protein